MTEPDRTQRPYFSIWRRMAAAEVHQVEIELWAAKKNGSPYPNVSGNTDS
jgi:hypothetical protein